MDKDYTLALTSSELIFFFKNTLNLLETQTWYICLIENDIITVCCSFSAFQDDFVLLRHVFYHNAIEFKLTLKRPTLTNAKNNHFPMWAKNKSCDNNSTNNQTYLYTFLHHLFQKMK